MTDLEARELIRYMERWGYVISDPPHPRSPGFRRLVVAIRRKPTDDHYDPEAIHVQICGAQGYPVRTSIQLDTAVVEGAKICPSHVELVDRYDVRRAFFTFGAMIDRGSTVDETVLDIQSTAPILEMNSSTLNESVGEQLVSETEALWAKTRVQWGTDDSGFVRNLGSKRPETLYSATIRSLWETYQESRILRQTFPQFHSMLRRELEWIEKSDLAMKSVPALDEMLSP